MWKLRGYLKDYRKELVLGPSFKLLEAIFELLIPALVAKMIDIGVQQQDRGYIVRMGIAMLAIAITGTACAFLCQYYAARVAQGFGTELRNRVFEKIGQLSHADLDRLDAVTLTNRVTNDVNALQWAVAMLIRLVIRAPFLCIGGFIMAFLLDFSLSLIILMALPVFTVLIAMLMKRSIPMFQQVQKRLDGMTRILRENLSGVRPIRAFAMEERETGRFRTANEELSSAAYRAGKASALLNPLTALVLNAAILLVVGFGGIRLHAGTLSAGTIIAFINYLTQILAAMIVVANLAVVFTKAAASAVRVNEVLDWVPSLRDADPEVLEAASEARGAVPAKPMNDPAAQKNSADAGPARTPYLSFEGVSFSYPGAGEPSLSNIRFAIEKGQTLGIVGVTGAGKSSLLSLIARFYDPDAGVVRLQGRDLRTLPIRGLRLRIGLVSQNPALFSGTVEENIRWGNQDASDDQVREAARLAQADGFIGEMQEGYGSRVERGGRNLSGGQRQRLAIARALVRKPDILLLDDSTSALDQATDAAFRQALRSLAGEMTVLCVSQRIRSVQDADCILVLEDGAVAGFGTHETLLGGCGVYAELFRTQMSVDEPETVVNEPDTVVNATETAADEPETRRDPSEGIRMGKIVEGGMHA